MRGMLYLDGKRKPHSEERSKAILKTNARPLSEIEVIVRVFREGMGPSQASPALAIHRDLVARQAATAQKLMAFGEADVVRAAAAWRDVLAEWQKVPSGAALPLIWKQ